MAKANIVFLDADTVPASVQWREPDFDHAFTSFGRSTPSEVAERIADADIVITNKAPVTSTAIAASPRLRLIAVAATGTDNVDLAAASAAGIAVVNVKGYAVNTVPEHALTLMLALRRSLVPYRAATLAGRWIEARQFSFFDYPIADLAGSTIAIIGGGTIGQSVARLCAAFSMEVIFSGRKGEAPRLGKVAFYDALAHADVISLHCPLTEQTRNLLGAPEFARMRRRPLIINTARGGLIDHEALERALESGQVSGAGLDVAPVEPPAHDSAIMRIARRDNVILTPHTAWASRQAVQRLADILIDNIERAWNASGGTDPYD